MLLFYREVVEGDEFLSLSSEQVVKLISSDELTVPSEEKVRRLKILIIIFKYIRFLSLFNEIKFCNIYLVSYFYQVFECVICWVNHASNSRKDILPKLMEHVRLPLASKEYLLKRVEEEPLLKNSLECM